ncbi:alpha/beta hydrolase [Microcoleus sp. FACHB-1515]|uniref:alpha/beta fold hydrolase n=1 Tax=Cyanophyceae TaxID=3028117 RepID=UPI001685DC46|nr:alpha/beta hydrolase [Microcoleus sp. FACHB-1515]MBD2090461.1 alpha/beta hydrolase [Microcoleus sp. FACHB-1515]
MPNLDALWLTVSPSFKCFDRPTLRCLSKQVAIAQWEYGQSLDEACSFESALVLLHDYLKQRDRPIDLIGHSTSGLLGLLYAQRHPERVRSLTLLSVGFQPAQTWQSHYYAQRQLLPCSREKILAHLIHGLFGYQERSMLATLIKILEIDLDRSLSPHSLLRQISLPPVQVDVPLLICGSMDDVVIDPSQIQRWQQHLLKDSARSRLWLCPGGRHFFHYTYSEQVSQEIFKFWQLPFKNEAAIDSVQQFADISIA